MSSGGFDFQSAVRIARTVLAHEQGLPVGTKRSRRPPAATPGAELLLVRLLEDIPPASFVPPVDQPDTFYPALQEAIGDNVGDASRSALLDFLRTKSEDTQVGSGLAVLCRLEDIGRNVAGIAGQSINMRLSYTDVVTVYNMHPNGFNIANIGGFAGNEAGSLGAGFCNAMQGDDGRIWLVSPDRRLLVRALDQIDSIQSQVDLLERTAGKHEQKLDAIAAVLHIDWFDDFGILP